MICIGCSNNKNNKNTPIEDLDSINKVSTHQKNQIHDTETEQIEKVINSFYEWYIENDYPYYQIVENKENEKCTLDTISFFTDLKKLDLFSEKFFKKEQERLKPCIEFISTVDYTQYQEADAYEYDEFCGDFYFMYWIRSQEPVMKVLARNTKKIDYKNATTEVFSYYQYPSEEGNFLSEVSLEKEQNSWKITEITFK
ncbi:hypothetical protein CGC56_07140 [Capnocytophaga canimorsus]|uniref:Uncharacterized protein n=2 Tax=Capnocytophaga canimorsus TaxID=28188 RepID=A0A250G6U1_9FLAO|nr:hypothetical protein CGC56_07140 [Capnocytophaga canimorsus]